MKKKIKDLPFTDLDEILEQEVEMAKYKVYCYIKVREVDGVSYNIAEPWSDDVQTDYTEVLKELIEAKEAGYDTAFIAEVSE